MQTPAGVIKMQNTIRKKYGVTEDGKSKFHIMAGTLGGQVSRTGGFYVNPELAKTAGAKGGRISRRGGSANHQDVLTARMMFLSGYSMAEIARQLKISYGVVRYAVGRK